MSEYWVSNKKYFCKYCNIYIADDKPSRTQHEGGLRHKGNVERFVRGLYKTGEKRKQDLEEEKREMERVERAAQAAFAQDVGAGLVKPGSSSTITSTAKQAGPSKPDAKPSNPYANYSTAESLGYVDLDAERQKMEAERRMNEGVVGAWEMVESTGLEGERSEEVEGQAGEGEAEARKDLERKRQAEVLADDDDIRPWKLRKKTMSAGLGEIYDPGVIPVKLKAKKEEPTPEPGSASATSTNSVPATSALPKWSAKGWNRPGEGRGSPKTTDNPPTLVALKTDVPTVKTEEGLGGVKFEEAEAVSTPTSSSLFRKRKAPVASRGRR
ncbi:hypothetical protein BC835DRAFT_1280786 [Cytidiella melzeri]|nr:hypothetical protein BC835DRAFT_1280786 [Cytidiella melzeri]